MIIKGGARGRARQLAAHLLRSDQNERIQLYECRGTLSTNVTDALVEMEARARAGRTQRPLYHASISPEPSHPLTERQIGEAVDQLEHCLGLHGQPRIVVLHRKKDRDHVHVVWSRVDAASGDAIADGWNFRHHERAARTLEAMFGHRPVPSSTDRSAKRGRTVEDYELRQDERGGRPISVVEAELTALWQISSSGTEFHTALTAAGYTLARGDRRVFIVIDRDGKVHSLARRIHGASTADVRAKMRDVPLSELPLAREAKALVGHNADRTQANEAFRQSAAGVTRSGYDSARISFKRGRSFILNAKKMLGPAVSRHPGDQTPSGVPIILIKRLPLSYRAKHSALIDSFARKIGLACLELRGDALIAAIEALIAERDAAIERLRAEMPRTEARPKARRRKRYRSIRRKRLKALSAVEGRG